MKYNSIAVEKIPNKDIGMTINDRLNQGFKILMENSVEVINLNKS